MNCSEYQNHLRDYMERLVPAQTARAIEQHVLVCARCAALHALAFEISCREVVDLCDDVVADTLPAERRATLERHLAICKECTDYLDSYRKTLALSKDACRTDPAAENAPIPEDLVRAILRKRPGTQ